MWAGAFITWLRWVTDGDVHLSLWPGCIPRYFLFYFSRHYSSMLLVLMSLEKCIALYFPFKTSKICTVKTAKWVTGIVGVIIAGTSVPYFFTYEKEPYYGRVYCDVRAEYFDPLSTTDSVLYVFLPFILMCIFNSAIVFKFMQAKCQNSANSTESTNQALSKAATRGTAMVVSVSIVFLVLTFPSAIDIALSDSAFESEPYRAVKNLTQYLNHSINGFLYLIVGSRFRTELLRMCGCGKDKKPKRAALNKSSSSRTMNSTKISTISDNRL